MTLAVQLTVEQLELLVEKASTRALDKVRAELAQPRASLDTDEAAAFLKVTTVALRRFAREGAIPSFRIGSLLRFDVPDLEAWKNAQKERSKRKAG